MKKRFILIISALLAAISVFTLVACGDDPDTTPRIELPAAYVELYVGQTAKIKPAAHNVTEALLWQSSDSGVASVDGEGVVTANKKGVAIVTVFGGDVTAEMTVTVVEPEAEAGISFAAQALSVTLYDKLTLTPTLVKVDPDALEWYSSNPAVAAVSDGAVRQKSLGTTVITVTDGRLSAKLALTVVDTDKRPTLSFNRDSAELLTGGSLDIVPTVKFDGNVVDGAEVYMNVADGKIAQLDNYTVTGKAKGETFIVADVIYRGYAFAAKYIPVTVKDDIDVRLSTNRADLFTREIKSLGCDKTATVTAAAYKNNAADIAAEIEWISADEGVATVKDGVITAIAEGKTTVTAKCVLSDGSVASSVVEVNVKRPVIAIKADELVLSKSGDTIDLDIPDDLTDVTLDRVTVNGETVAATLKSDGVSFAKAALAPFFGESVISVKLTDVVYDISTLLITKSVSSMSDLRDVAALANGDTLDGYFVLEKDVVANNADDFRFLSIWSNESEKGFVGTFDGRGFGIYGLKIHELGLFECVGEKGLIKNLALVNAGGGDIAIATECRGTVSNVFVTSDSKKTLINMSDDAKLIGGFAILPAEGSNVIGAIHSSTCAVKNFYALAGGMIGYTAYSQGQEPTIAARDNVYDLRRELSGLDFAASDFDKGYWELRGGTPIFKTYIANIPSLKILGPSEIVCSAGQPISIVTTDHASVTLKAEVDGVSSDGKSLTATKNASATVVATGLFGQTAEKQINFVVVEFHDRTKTRLFDYMFNSDSLTFALPDDIVAIDKLSFGNGVYYTAADGYTVEDGKVTVSRAIMSQAASKYGDGTITIAVGDNHYNYGCSFVTKVITSYDDLKHLHVDGNTLDGYYVLDRDITADNEAPMPHIVGTWSSHPDNGFIGIFDGRGHSITNLYLTAYGLFGSIGKCEIRNIALVNVSVREKQAGEDVANPAVFGAYDCQSTTFRNVFVSTDAGRMFGNGFRTMTLENVMFVSSKADAVIFGAGNNENSGSLTLKNVMAVCSGFYDYYGGTPITDNAVKFDTKDAMLKVLADNNRIDEWDNSLISYADGKILFDGKQVL